MNPPKSLAESASRAIIALEAMRSVMTLPINEIFESVQGEASFTGSPAVFIRLQGCPVGCPWCDTAHTWAVDPTDVVPAAEMAAKVSDAPTFARMTPAELVAHVEATTHARHVVITGGEPALYDLRPLSALLIKAGRSVQLETSGTSEIRIDPRAFVTVSPKVDMPGGLAVRTDALLRANEIKMPVGKPADVERLRDLLGSMVGRLCACPTGSPTVWLQPLSQSPKATALCVAAATANGWRISIQTHKYLGVR